MHALYTMKIIEENARST